MKIITVQGWDCCSYIHSIWVNEHMKPSDKVDIGNFDDDKIPEKLIKTLKQAGFRPAKDQTITFGGNL